MVHVSDFKSWRYTCLVSKGRFVGKQVVPIFGAVPSIAMGTVRATDELYAKKQAKKDVIERYDFVMHVVNIEVEEIK